MLSFGELELSPCPASSIFLSFDHSRVPGKKAVGPQGSDIGFIVRNKGSGYTVPTGTGLPGTSSPGYIDKNIELSKVIGNIERLFDYVDQAGVPEVLVDSLAVDIDNSLALSEVHPRYRGLSSSGTVRNIICHLASSPCVLIEFLRLLRRVGMVGAGVHLDVLKDLPTEPVLRQHSTNSLLHGKCGFP